MRAPRICLVCCRPTWSIRLSRMAARRWIATAMPATHKIEKAAASTAHRVWVICSGHMCSEYGRRLWPRSNCCTSFSRSDFIPCIYVVFVNSGKFKLRKSVLANNRYVLYMHTYVHTYVCVCISILAGVKQKCKHFIQTSFIYYDKNKLLLSITLHLYMYRYICLYVRTFIYSFNI